MERLNPLNDYIFWRIMGEEESKECLISFLSALLESPVNQILSSLELVDSKAPSPEMLFDQTVRLNIQAKLNNGTLIDIEVPLIDPRDIGKRSLFSFGGNPLQSGMPRENSLRFDQEITIHLLRFAYEIDSYGIHELHMENDRFHHCFHRIREPQKRGLANDSVETHIIEMPKFSRFFPKDLNGNGLHRWLRFFDPATPKEEIKVLAKLDPAIKNAAAKLDSLGSDPATLTLYRIREAALQEQADLGFYHKSR